MAAQSQRKVPQAIGPYRQVVVAGPWVFVSGQIPLDPETGEVVQGSVEAQTRQVLENLRALLESVGLGLAQVVKTTLYLRDLRDFDVVNRIYGEYFSQNPPARATVQVAGLPRGVALELEAVAYREGD